MAKKFWAYLSGAAFGAAAAAAGYAVLKAYKSAVYAKEQTDEPVITIDPEEEADIFDEVGEKFENTAEKAAEEAEDIGAELEDTAEKAAEKAADFGDTLKKAFESAVENAADKTADFVQKIKRGADDMFGGSDE